MAMHSPNCDGGDFGLSGLGAMASDGRNRSRRMAHWIATSCTTNDRLCVLQSEQRVVGDLGRLCRGVRVDRLADLSVSDEPARTEEKREGQGKPTCSRLTVAVEILLEASGIHPQKDALKEDQRVGVGVQPQITQSALLRMNPQKAIIRR